VRGYESVLGPMEKVSALFAQKTQGVPTSDPRYRSALFYLLTSQTSCYRYWGSGIWTVYGREVRAEESSKDLGVSEPHLILGRAVQVRYYVLVPALKSVLVSHEVAADHRLQF
jgi:hypothetical protein